MPAKRRGCCRLDGRAALRAHPSALRRQSRGQRPPAAVFPGHRSRGLPGRSWDWPAVTPRIAAAQGQQRLPHGEPGLGEGGQGGREEGATGPGGLPRHCCSPFAECMLQRDRILRDTLGRERAGALVPQAETPSHLTRRLVLKQRAFNLCRLRSTVHVCCETGTL